MAALSRNILDFVLKSSKVARVCVAILARTMFLESSGRYERIFRSQPPTKFAQFTERVPIFKRRLNQNGSTATSYGWFVWQRAQIVSAVPRLVRIPGCRKTLEREGDYGSKEAAEQSKAANGIRIDDLNW
jgi:hypothetical protein